MRSEGIGIPHTMLRRMTFGNFNPNGARTSTPNQRESLSMALDAARRYAENPESWLFLDGNTGVGKTHLAVAVANLQHEYGTNVKFWSVADLLDYLRNAYSRSNDSAFYTIFDETRNTELLVLDDFAAPSMTDWSLERLYQLIAYRHDRLLPTVITSQYILWQGADNSDWSQLEGRQHWESIRSRLSDSDVVTECLMVAPDYRNRGA